MRGYIRTLHSPTAIQSMTAVHLSEGKCSLVLACGRHLKVYSRLDSTLSLDRDIALFGQVLYLVSYPTARDYSDVLLVVAEPHFVGFLQLGETTVATLAQTDLPNKNRVRVSIPLFDYHPEHNVLAVHLHQERLQFISVTKNCVSPDILRVNEYHCVDHQIRSLALINESQIALISHVGAESRLSVFDFEAQAMQMLQFREVGRDEKCEVVKRTGPTHWIAFFDGKTLLYSAKNQLLETITHDFGGVTAISEWEEGCVLVSTAANELFSLSISAGLPSRLVFSSPSASASEITRIDPDFIFLSTVANSSFLCNYPLSALKATPVWELKSLAPVVSMRLRNCENALADILAVNRTMDISAVMTFKWGTKVTPEADLEVGKAVKLWSLVVPWKATQATLLVLSFVNATKVLVLLEETMKEGDLEGFAQGVQTVFIGIGKEGIVQVTKEEVRLIGTETWDCFSIKTTKKETVLACSSDTRIYTISSDSVLTLFTSSSRHITEEKSVVLPFEAGSVTCTQAYLAIGAFTDNLISLLDPIYLTTVWSESIEINTSPSCLIISDFSNADLHLICCLGDGNLLTYGLTTQGMVRKSIVHVGNLITDAVPLEINHLQCVLIVSDRPMLLYYRNGSMQQVHVNFDHMRMACHFSHPTVKNGLAVLTGAELRLMSLSDTTDVGITLDRYLETVKDMEVADGKVYVLTQQKGMHFVKVYILDSNEDHWTYALSQEQEALCFLPVSSYLILGSGFPDGTGTISTLLPFTDLPPSVLSFPQHPASISSYNTNVLIIAFQQAITAWSLSEEGKLERQMMARYPGTMVLCVDVAYNLVAVGDLVRDVVVYICSPSGFEQVGKSTAVTGVVGVKFHSPTVLLVIDQHRNLLVLSISDLYEIRSFSLTNGLHIGDSVTCMQRVPFQEIGTPEGYTLLSSNSGALYVFRTIEEKAWNLLAGLSPLLTESGVAFFAHSDFREVKKQPITVNLGTVLDGDLLMRFFQFSRTQQQEMVRTVGEQIGTEVSVDEVQLMITILANSY